MAQDYARLNMSCRDRVLDLLSDLRWHRHTELHAVGGVRYSARRLELRHLGYQIETRSIGDQGRGYRLISRVTGKPPKKRVKVFLPEDDVDVLLENGVLTERAREALVSARASFATNRDRL